MPNEIIVKFVQMKCYQMRNLNSLLDCGCCSGALGISHISKRHQNTNSKMCTFGEPPMRVQLDYIDADKTETLTY